MNDNEADGQGRVYGLPPLTYPLITLINTKANKTFEIESFKESKYSKVNRSYQGPEHPFRDYSPLRNGDLELKEHEELQVQQTN